MCDRDGPSSWEARISPDRQEDFSERAQSPRRPKLIVLRQRRTEEAAPLWTRVRIQLPTFLASLVVIGGTTGLGVGPLLAGSILLGKQAGVPAGASIAAITMVIVFWAAMRSRYRDVPGGWVAGLLAFVIGILMLLLAPILGAQALIPSRPVAGVVGAAIGAGLVTGALLIGKRRDLLWPNSMGYPGPFPGTGGL